MIDASALHEAKRAALYRERERAKEREREQRQAISARRWTGKSKARVRTGDDGATSQEPRAESIASPCFSSLHCIEHDDIKPHASLITVVAPHKGPGPPSRGQGAREHRLQDAWSTCCLLSALDFGNKGNLVVVITRVSSIEKAYVYLLDSLLLTLCSPPFLSVGGANTRGGGCPLENKTYKLRDTAAPHQHIRNTRWRL